MNPEVKAKWVAALRSGEYKQARGYLRVAKTVDGASGFCCLGVLCDLAVKEGVIEAPMEEDGIYVFGPNKETKTLPGVVTDWAELEDESPEVMVDGEEVELARLNDTGLDLMDDLGRWSFEQIADTIEENL